MSIKPTPEKISKFVQRYIDKYHSDTTGKKEYIYKVPVSELAELGDFIHHKYGRAFMCFYPLSAKEYDETEEQSLAAQFHLPKLLKLKDNKLELGLNVVINTRDGAVNRDHIVEMVAHELNHAYATYRELQQNYISHPIWTVAYYADKFRAKKHKLKYTYTQRNERYGKVFPKLDQTFHDNFRWIAYFFTQTEMNATLAGIEAFLYEHNNDISKLEHSYGYQNFLNSKYTFDEIKEKATDADWAWVQKNATYIYNRKDEPVSRFKNRYLKYYENMFKKFEEKLNKIIIKQNDISNKFKSGSVKLQQKQILNGYEKQNIK